MNFWKTTQDYKKKVFHFMPYSGHWRAVICALFGGAFVSFLSKEIRDDTLYEPWLFASIGASTLLVFSVPKNPFAQPRAVIGGNLFSAIIGVALANGIDDPRFGIPITVMCCMVAMRLFNCFHPPAASTGMAASLNKILTFKYVLVPVLVDSILLIIAAYILNNATGKAYPTFWWAPPPAAAPKPAAPTATPGASNVAPDEVEGSALKRYSDILDIDSGDVAMMISQVELYSVQKKLTTIRVSSIMSSKVFSVEASKSLTEAWSILRANHLKSLPVTDADGKVVGIITQDDYLKGAIADVKPAAHWTTWFNWKLINQFVDQSLQVPPKTVKEVMSTTVRTVSQNASTLDLLGAFQLDGYHHVPVLNGEKKLVGVVTASDLLKAIQASANNEDAKL